MPFEKVIVTIDGETGNISMEADGFKGEGCNVLGDVERSLGSVTKREAKSEKYQYVLPDILPNHVG